MSVETREHILQVGKDLVLRKGFHNVGLQELLSTAGVPKGSFYHYFKSKDDFGLEMIKYHREEVIEVFDHYLNDKIVEPKQRFLNLFNKMKEVYDQEDFTKGCLIGNCSQELAPLSGSYADSLKTEFEYMEERFRQVIEEGQESGNIKPGKHSEKLAAFLINSWEGALVRMKAMKSNEPIDLLIEHVEEIL